ncbi:cell wall assembly protein [Cellvibrio fontiphilus]|uniref:Cell wall assembly protein n=1 Tax=Cellvibrio fontiphilus TaxID=1815559 RepID=A0ABV7FL79_9GAMM
MNQEFLKQVESFNYDFCSIEIDGKMESINLPFWSFTEIESGLALREEWDVLENFIPFYGNWHSLFCLDSKSGAVIYINDEREIIYSWNNTENFINCLSSVEVAFESNIEPISAWLSPELFAKVTKE